MYFIYQAVITLLTPFIRLYWWRRSWKDQRYAKRVQERFGYYLNSNPVDVWIHAASVGESKIAMHVVGMLQSMDLSCVVTVQTPTGLAVLQNQCSDQMICCHAPLDRHDCVARFLEAFKPKLTFLIETELWPGWIHACNRAGIPVWLINARCHERKFQAYQRIKKIWPFFELLSGVVAVTQLDEQRYSQLGVLKTQVVPNLKWLLPEKPHKATQTPLVCAGSVHKEEIFALLRTWHDMPISKHSRLVIVPRHLDYLDEIDQFLERHHYHDMGDMDTVGVTVVREMGGLMNYYQSAKVCIVGGSFISHGGQNPLEPASCAKPIVMGPSTFNFDHPVRALVDAGALVLCQSIPEALAEVSNLLSQPEMADERGRAGAHVVMSHKSVLVAYQKIIRGLVGERLHVVSG